MEGRSDELRHEDDAPPANADDESFMELLRADFRNHGGKLANRALWAMAVYRFGRWSFQQKSPAMRWVTSKIYGALSPLSRFVTGVTLDRLTRVGRDVHLIHCEGPISIHPRAVIGERVGIMHNVTIGETPDGGVPTIGNDVFIGVGAVIVGNVKIGAGAQIAANSLVIADVPANHVAVGVPARVYPGLARRARKP
jgi:serine O-acetyltransferase